MKKSALFLPFLGLIAFTIAGIFLTFSPIALQLSPSEAPASPFSFISLPTIFATVFSVAALSILIISLFRNKK